jgi:hypothetical protein
MGGGAAVKSLPRITCAVLVFLFARVAAASPTTIGVFFDADATDCDASVTPSEPFNVYVSAALGTDAAGAGITGAEFRVEGLSGIPVLSVTPNPASAGFAVGNPTAGGCNIAFPSCMTGEGPRRVVLLYTISCLAPSPLQPRTVSVLWHAVPIDVWDPCRPGPNVVLCDYPVFTRVCASGGSAFINNGSCAVAVQPTTWSAVKSLFAADTVLLQPDSSQDRR